MNNQDMEKQGSPLGVVVSTVKDHYKLVGAMGAITGALLVVCYCGGINHYPSGLTVADTLFFLWVIVVFGFYYSAVATLFFLASMFWLAILASPINWLLKVTGRKTDLIVPFPKLDKMVVFGLGVLSNALILGYVFKVSHSLISVLVTFTLIGFAYTLLDHVAKKPWSEKGLVDSSGKSLSNGRISLRAAKFILLGLIYLSPLWFGQVGGNITSTTFETMGVRMVGVDVVIEAATYQAILTSLQTDHLLEKLQCDLTTCTIKNVVILFTGVGTSTKMQVESQGNTTDIVMPTSAIKLLIKRRPNKS